MINVFLVSQVQLRHIFKRMAYLLADSFFCYYIQFSKRQKRESLFNSYFYKSSQSRKIFNYISHKIVQIDQFKLRLNFQCLCWTWHFIYLLASHLYKMDQITFTHSLKRDTKGFHFVVNEIIIVNLLSEIYTVNCCAHKISRYQNEWHVRIMRMRMKTS